MTGVLVAKLCFGYSGVGGALQSCCEGVFLVQA